MRTGDDWKRAEAKQLQDRLRKIVGAAHEHDDVQLVLVSQHLQARSDRRKRFEGVIRENDQL